MNYALIGALLFLTSSYLISSLKGKDRKVKVKAILILDSFFSLVYLCLLIIPQVAICQKIQ